MPYPRKSSGFIDEKATFQLVIGTMGLSYEYLEDCPIKQLGWLIENHYEEEQRQLELLAYTVSVGYIQAKTGKKIDMFEKAETTKMTPITPEQKQKELDDLNKIFAK